MQSAYTLEHGKYKSLASAVDAGTSHWIVSARKKEVLLQDLPLQSLMREGNKLCYMGGCQNYGPFFGYPIIIRHLLFKVPKKGS